MRGESEGGEDVETEDELFMFEKGIFSFVSCVLRMMSGCGMLYALPLEKKASRLKPCILRVDRKESGSVRIHGLGLGLTFSCFSLSRKG